MSACVSANAGDCRFFFRETGNDGMRQQVFPVFSFCSILCLCSYGDIHFQGNHHYTADTLVRYLDTQDVRYGMKKKKINCEELEAGMREAFPQITWVSARVSGTSW